MQAYRDLCKLAEMGTVTTKPRRNGMVYIWGDDAVLVEDLVAQWGKFMRRFGAVTTFQPSSAEEMVEALDTPPDPGAKRRLIIARDADRWLRSRLHDRLMLRIDRESALRGRVTLCTGSGVLADQDADWWSEKAIYGRIRVPAPEVAGAWVATRSIGALDYTKRSRLDDALIPVELGIPFMEWCGWDFAAALQGVAAIRAYFSEPVTREQIEALVPPVVGVRFADELVFGSRSAALRSASGVNGNEVLRVLGLIRYHLRMFGSIRSVGGVQIRERELLARTGLDVWRWRTKYRPRYAMFTDEKIRLRLIEVSRARIAHERGAEGTLEVLASVW